MPLSGVFCAWPTPASNLPLRLGSRTGRRQLRHSDWSHALGTPIHLAAPFDANGMRSCLIVTSVTITPRQARSAMENRSIEFFESQFKRQVRESEYALNSFETRALEFLIGRVLDLGCGLGNLSLEAGRRGHPVVAVDASETAIERLRADAERDALPVGTIRADLADWAIDQQYDTIVCIGLLMFFPRERALGLLRDIQDHVAPGGRAAVNVLVEGTTFMGMFDPRGHYLFGADELRDRFAGWHLLAFKRESFPAPGETRKEFVTIVAERPDGG